MDAQTIIVVVVIAVAVIYAAIMFLRKTKAFSPKAACGDDCGCGSKAKTTKAAH